MERLADPRKLEHIPEAKHDSDFEAFLALGHSNAPPAVNNHRNGAHGLFFGTQPLSQSSQPASQSPSSQAQSKATKKLEDFTSKFRGALSALTTVSDSDTVVRELSGICDISRNLIPQKRLYIRTVESVLEEFTESEENGGFPEKELKEVVKELHSALEANFNTQVDVALIQQIITLMKELPAVKPKATAAKRKSLQKKRQRVVNDDDEDVDGDHEADVEEEEEDDENEEGEEDDIEEDLLDIVANEEDIEASQAQVEILQPDYIQKKREESAVTLQPERLMITRTIEKALDKIKTKRGYSWKLENGEVVEKESTEDDSLVVNPVVVAPQVILDPISRKEITEKPVKSSKCPSHHLYEERTLLPMLNDRTRYDPRGMKCSYLGCAVYLLRQDLVEDEDYARLLSRSAATQGRQTQENHVQAEEEVFFD